MVICITPSPPTFPNLILKCLWEIFLPLTYAVTDIIVPVHVVPLYDVDPPLETGGQGDDLEDSPEEVEEGRISL